MEAYGLPVKGISTVIFLLGTTIHSFVIFVTSKKTGADSQAYGLFMRIYSSLSIFLFVCGWLLINRLTFNNHILFVVYYGFGSFLGPNFCSRLDAIFQTFINVMTVMVPTGMAFRVLIVYDIKLKKALVVGVTGIVILLEFPSIVILMRSLVPVEQYMNQFTAFDLEETLKHPTIVLSPSTQFEFWYLNTIASKHIYIGVPLTFILGLVTLRKVSSRRVQMSAKTAKIHRAFIWLLFIEAMALCMGGVYEVGNKYLSLIFPEANVPVIMSFYYSIFVAMTPLFQGIAMLCLIPFFRTALFGMCNRKKTVSSVVHMSISKIRATN